MWYSLSADSHTHTSSTTVMIVDVTSAQLKASVSTLFTGWSDIYGSVSVEAMLVMSQWVEVTAITTTERRRRAAISTSSFNAARTLNLSRTWMSWKTVSFSPPGAGTRTSWTEHCDLCSFCAELFFTVTSNVTCSSSQTEYHTWIKTL